jgi:hypothetical protein
MIPILSQLDDSLKTLQTLVVKLQGPVSEDEEVVGFWNSSCPSFEEAQKASESMTKRSIELSSLFKGLGTLVLCNLDDRIKQILNEIKDRQRSDSIFNDWDELEAELVDELLSAEDVERHKGAIMAFTKHLVEEKESAERVALTFSNSDTLEASSHSKSLASPIPLAPVGRKSECSTSELGQNASSLSGSLDDLNWNNIGPSIRPKRISVLFVDWDNTGISSYHVILQSISDTIGEGEY